MLYLPSTIAQAELDVLNEPYFGGEWDVYLSHVAAVHLGDINFTASGTATYTDDPATGVVAATDIQAVVITPILSTASSVITFACMDNSGTPVSMNGVATFAPPAWVTDQSYFFPRGYAVDLIPATPGKMYTAITSLTTATNANKNAKVALYQLPLRTDYYRIGCTNEISFNSKARMAKGVDCGMETDAFVKAGKANPGKLDIASKYKSFADGLSRFAGMKGTCMLEGIKDGQVTGDRIVFTQYRPTVTNELPEGDGDAVVKAEGKYVEALFFTAPYAP